MSKTLLVFALLLGMGQVGQAQEKKQDAWTLSLGGLEAPAMVWPEDRFTITLPVFGGRKDEEVEATLEAVRISDREGKPTSDKKVKLTRRGKFERGRAAIHFEMSLSALLDTQLGKDNAGLFEGTWEFRATLPRHPGEKFDRPIHESAPVRVAGTNKKLRVLLFIDGPNRDYQFVRTICARFPQKLEFFVHAKNSGFNPDVDEERGLKEFPSLTGPDPKDKKGASLSNYDVVIAFDPDWASLRPEQLKRLQQWVSREGGGLIFAAGPVHSGKLTKNDKPALWPLQDMLPVALKDAPAAIDLKTPYPLNFTADAERYPFLKLDDRKVGPLAGWDSFFWDDKGKTDVVSHGFFLYQPVESVRPAAKVIATFAGPRATRMNDGRDEQPYFAEMRYGTGKTFFVSGATWGLRRYRETYHERFWLGLTRYMGGNPARETPQKVVPVLIVDGDPTRAKDEKSDSYYVKTAIDSITANPYEVVLAHELAGGNAVKALERDDLARFGAVLLLNVRDLKARQLANLEKYAADGGGVGFFLGPKVSTTYYNEHLFKEGKGLFPVPLDETYYPPKNEAMLKREVTDGDMVLLRLDLLPDVERYPVLGPIFRDKESRRILKDLPVKRYFKVPRGQWHPDPAQVFELATLPNDHSIELFQKPVLATFYSQKVRAILDDPANKKYAPGFNRHRNSIVATVAPTSGKKNHHLAQALENLLTDPGRPGVEQAPNMAEFWSSKDERVQKLRAEMVDLLHKARYGDPLIVASKYGKGRVLAVMTTAGPDWNDWAVFGRSLGSLIYQPFIWESVNYLSKEASK